MSDLVGNLKDRFHCDKAHNDSFWTDEYKANIAIQIRLLLQEQSDQGLNCLPVYLHLLQAFLYCNAGLFEFKRHYRCPNLEEFYSIKAYL